MVGDQVELRNRTASSDPLRTSWGSSPPYSQAGEYVAGLAVSTHCPHSDKIHTDFQSLVGLEQRPQADYCSRGNFYAGITMLTRGAPGWSLAKQFVKVKAHQDPASFPTHSREWELATGNYWADREANRARERLILPAAHEYQHHQAQGAALR